MSGFDLIHTYSGDIKILFCLHKFPHAITEVRACGSESPAIVGKTLYAFAQLANVRIYVYVCSLCVYECMYANVCMYLYVRTCVCTCIHECMYVHTYVLTYECMYVCTCGPTYVYDCMYVFMKEGTVLFNDALNKFYLRLYGVRHMVEHHTDSERGNHLPPYGLLFPINIKGSFICTIP